MRPESGSNSARKGTSRCAGGIAQRPRNHPPKRGTSAPPAHRARGNGGPDMMTAESASAEKDAEPPRHGTVGASPDIALNGSFGGIAAGWLGHEIMTRPANASIRTLAMQR